MNEAAALPLQHAPLDPITVEVIGNAFSSIVEEMGETLVRASYSTNIKERRDTPRRSSTRRGGPWRRPSIFRSISGR